MAYYLVLSTAPRAYCLYYTVSDHTKMKEQKRSSKTIDIVSYALEVSINGVICVLA